jgi:hypothetical protein
MAEDINQEAQELARILAQVNYELAQFGQISATTARQRYDAEMEAKTGIKNFSEGSEKAVDAVGHMAQAGTAAASAMFKGEKGAAAFNSALDSMSQAATAAGVVLSLLIPGGPVIKAFIAGLTALTGAVLSYTKAANEMADQLYKSFTTISKSGAAASDGMTGLFRDAKRLGISMNELDSLVSQVSDSSRDLALFAGSVFEGRQRFAQIGEAMEPFREGLLNLGMTQVELNERTIKYIALQSRLGITQTKSNEEIARSARKYILEQDLLAKLTGQNREEQEKLREQALSEQRFRAKVEEVRATQGEAAAERLQKANLLISSQSAEAGQAFRDLTTGFVTTEAAQKGLVGSQGELLRVGQLLIAGTIDEFEATRRAGRAISDFAKKMTTLAQLGVLEEFSLNYAQSVELGTFANRDLAEMAKVLRIEQEKQGATGKKATDALQQQYTELILSQQLANKGLEEFVFRGTVPAVGAMEQLAKATIYVAEKLNALADFVKGVLDFFGVGKDTEQELREKTPREQVEVQAQQEIATAKAREAADLEKAAREELVKAKKENADRAKLREIDDRIVQYRQERIEAERQAELAAKRAARLARLAQKQTGQGAGVSDTGEVPGVTVQDRQQRAGQPGLAPQPMTARDLRAMGLRLKEGDVQRESGMLNPRVIDLAKKIQNLIPGFDYFSAFDDDFHKEKAAGSEHVKGNAVDFTLAKRPSPNEGSEITRWLKSMGASKARDEYNNPSPGATGGHIHAEVPGYADGGVAMTPQLAFVAEKGPEVMMPLDNGAIPIKMDFSGMRADQSQHDQLGRTMETLQRYIETTTAPTPMGNMTGLLSALRQDGTIPPAQSGQIRVDMPEIQSAQATEDFATSRRFKSLLDAMGDFSETGFGFGMPVAQAGSAVFPEYADVAPGQNSDFAMQESVDQLSALVQELQQREQTNTDTDTGPSSADLQRLLEAMNRVAQQGSEQIVMLSELVRAARNGNDISSRILQVSTN